MENNNTTSAFSGVEEEMELPPGFRFHPTDEELISHYLCPKVADTSFSAVAIGEVDLNKVEPWDLPCKSPPFLDFCVLFFADLLVLELDYLVWTMESYGLCFFYEREGENGGKGMVFLLRERQEVSNWAENEQSNRSRVLEGDRER